MFLFLIQCISSPKIISNDLILTPVSGPRGSPSFPSLSFQGQNCSSLKIYSPPGGLLKDLHLLITHTQLWKQSSPESGLLDRTSTRFRAGCMPEPLTPPGPQFPYLQNQGLEDLEITALSLQGHSVTFLLTTSCCIPRDTY